MAGLVERRNNLWDPVDGDEDFGSHGSFDNRARPFSFQVWADLRRCWITLGLGASAAALGAIWYARQEAVRKQSPVNQSGGDRR